MYFVFACIGFCIGLIINIGNNVYVIDKTSNKIKSNTTIIPVSSIYYDCQKYQLLQPLQQNPNYYMQYRLFQNR